MQKPADTVFFKAVKEQADADVNAVLLVDDERAIRMKVARDISSFAPNAIVYEASNGLEGLERLAEIRSEHSKDPLLIVLDLNMPLMDGWEFIARLKEQYESAGKDQGIPIVVFSSTSGEKATTDTVHDRKTGYVPMVTVAKEVCSDKSMYNAADEKSFLTWLEYLLDAGMQDTTS